FTPSCPAFLVHPFAALRDLHSFPTRRSSDLAVSKSRFLGAIPVRLIKPVVGRKPTIPVNAAGPRTDVLVSVPTASTAKSAAMARSEEHTSELQSRENLVCRLLLEKKKTHKYT